MLINVINNVIDEKKYLKPPEKRFYVVEPTGENQPKSQGKRQKELVLDIWYRQGGAYEDRYNCEVIYGDAEVEKEYYRHICEMNYPYRCPGEMRIRPKSIPVVVLCRGVDNTGNEEVRVKDMYVYTQKGWKYIKVKEERIPL